MNYVGLYTLIRREVQRIMRVFVQTLVTPWISALLYIFIFGYVIGRRIELVGGFSYIDFVLPGILMMNVISSAFSGTSFSLYFHRFTKSIHETLVAPLSYFEMIVGYIAGSIIRATMVGLGIFVIAVIFSAANIQHLGLFLFYIIAVSIIFSLIGILVGLWAKGFEQLNILSTFVIMPLNFLGGVFYSIHMLPDTIREITLFNPMFYFIDGIRYSMIGVRESNYLVGLAVIFGLILVLGLIVWRLFKTGWRIRE